MNKTENITPKELRKIMKLSVSIGIELGFYIAYSQCTISVDTYKNWDSSKTKLYSFSVDDAKDIMKLITAYARLYKHKMFLQ